MMKDQITAGASYYAEPGLVVVAEVTRPVMEAAVAGLVEDHFFDGQPCAR